MTLKEPTSTDECVYFTKREIGKGHAKAWVYKGNCPKCKDGLIGKPRDPKTGRPKIRSEDYECPKCKYCFSKDEYELTLTAEIKYSCPHCNFFGEIKIPFKRKKVKMFDEELQKTVSADALIFNCEKCAKRIEITKKMK